jgi:3-isopropylmalate/(R)-2-methylmalate dehydratase small subunit
VWALRDGGFTVVIASGFGDIFRRNAVNNGLLLIDVPQTVVAEVMDLVERDPGTEVTGDLVRCELRFAGRVTPFQFDAKSRRRLLMGLDSTEATLLKRERIAAFEARRHPWLPIVNLSSDAEH